MSTHGDGYIAELAADAAGFEYGEYFVSGELASAKTWLEERVQGEIAMFRNARCSVNLIVVREGKAAEVIDIYPALTWAIDGKPADDDALDEFWDELEESDLEDEELEAQEDRASASIDWAQVVIPAIGDKRLSEDDEVTLVLPHWESSEPTTLSFGENKLFDYH